MDVSKRFGGRTVLVLEVVGESAVLLTAVIGDAVDSKVLVTDRTVFAVRVLLVCEVVGVSVVLALVVVGDADDVALDNLFTEVCV